MVAVQFPFDKLPKITSPFGWRIHPVEKIKKHHNGVDFGAAAGTWIENIAAGRVIHAGPSKTKIKNGEPGGFGYYVQTRHFIAGQWVVATYAHMTKGSIVVKKGAYVRPGDPLGKVGSSGMSTAPHLHFEICKGKSYVWSADGSSYYDPIAFLKAAIAAEKQHALADKATPDVEVKPTAKPTAKK